MIYLWRTNTIDWHSGSWIKRCPPSICFWLKMYTHMSVLSPPSVVIDRGMAVFCVKYSVNISFTRWLDWLRVALEGKVGCASRGMSLVNFLPSPLTLGHPVRYSQSWTNSRNGSIFLAPETTAPSITRVDNGMLWTINCFDINSWMSSTPRCNISKNDMDGFTHQRLTYVWKYVLRLHVWRF